MQLRLYSATIKDTTNPSNPLHTVILDARFAIEYYYFPLLDFFHHCFSTLNEVDSTGVKQLAAIVNEMKSKYKVRFLLANVRGM